MSLETYLAFVAASVLLILIPGPNVALIVANSMARGVRHGLLTVAGTTSAAAVHLILIAFGMTALMAALAQRFEWLRWAGVVYLLYLGLDAWLSPAPSHSAAPSGPPGGAVLRGFLVSLTNPKTLLFYGAFFPQFVALNSDPGRQLTLLSLTFLAIAATLDSAWAIAAARLSPMLAGAVLRRRLSGTVYLAAAIGLAAARRAS